MCLHERKRTHLAKAVAHFFGGAQPPSGLRFCFPCTDPHFAQTRARASLPLPVTQVPITWQAGDFLSASEALAKSLINFVSKTDDAKWL